MNITYDAKRATSHRGRHDGCIAYDDALDIELGFGVLAALHVEGVDPGWAFAARIGGIR